MKVLVTGATGFVGRYLIPLLIDERIIVSALGRSMSSLNKCYPYGVEKVDSDYSEASLEANLAETDVIIHLASQLVTKDSPQLDLAHYYDTNVQITQNLMNAASRAGVKRIIQTSSISVYSSRNKLPFSENDLPYPSSMYGVSKLTSEHVASLIGARCGIEVVNLRLARLYGAKDRATPLFSKLAKQAMSKEQLSILGDGSYSFDYLYVKDAVDAILEAVKSHELTGTINIGSGISMSIKNIAEVINEVYDNKGNIMFEGSENTKEMPYRMNVKTAENVLSWTSKWSLKEAVFDMKKIDSE